MDIKTCSDAAIDCNPGRNDRKETAKPEHKENPKTKNTWL